MFTNPGFTLADQLFWIVDCFCKTMAPEACRRLGSLSGVIWNRVKGFERRFSKLYAMWKAGTLPKARARPHDTPTPALPRSAGEGANGADGAVAHPGLLPRGSAWLRKLLPMSAGTLLGGLESLLGNFPEMKEFVAACPQVGRMLRPMCRMVGLKVPEWLRLPTRVRAKRAPREPGLRRRPQARPAAPSGPRAPAVAPVCDDSGATDAVAMRERVAAWVAGRPQPPVFLLPLGLAAECAVDPWTVSSKRQFQGG